jgi:tryptophan halogenase
MMGQGLMPKQHHGAGRVLPVDGLKQQMMTLRNMIDNAVSQMPQHGDFIQSYCRAGKL